jgi:hypothetical protein
MPWYLSLRTDKIPKSMTYFMTCIFLYPAPLLAREVLTPTGIEPVRKCPEKPASRAREGIKPSADAGPGARADRDRARTIGQKYDLKYDLRRHKKDQFLISSLK